MNKGSYNYKCLIDYCGENNIILLDNYENTNMTRDSYIKGDCTNEICNDYFNKTFKRLKISGPFCNSCTSLNKNNKVKNTFLKKYGCENPFQSEEIKEKIKQTNLIKYGNEYIVNTKLFKQKSSETILKNYNVTHPSKSEEIREKIKQTNLKKYNCENPFQSEEIKGKIKQTNLKKYNCENPTYSKDIREKTKKKCFEKYGYEHTCQRPHVKEKLKQSILNKYNVEYPFQSKKYQEIFKNKCLQKYGVENPQQVPEIAEKASKNSYRKKIYILPSGKELICQGYEPFALEKLIKEENITEEDIVTGCKNVPQIWYDDEQCKKHRHYVDIFIPSQNRCIEVKSTWTAEKKKDNIYLKQNAAKELGYQYEIWIFNAKKELLEVKT